MYLTQLLVTVLSSYDTSNPSLILLVSRRVLSQLASACAHNIPKPAANGPSTWWQAGGRSGWGCVDVRRRCQRGLQPAQGDETSVRARAVQNIATLPPKVSDARIWTTKGEGASSSDVFL